MLKYFVTTTRERVQNRSYARREVYRSTSYHIWLLFKQKPTLPSYQHHLNPFLIKKKRKKSDEKAIISVENRWFGVQTTFHHIFPSKNSQCVPLGELRNLCANTGIRLMATHPFDRYVLWIRGLCDPKMLRNIGRNPGELKRNFLVGEQPLIQLLFCVEIAETLIKSWHSSVAFHMLKAEGSMSNEHLARNVH